MTSLRRNFFHTLMVTCLATILIQAYFYGGHNGLPFKHVLVCVALLVVAAGSFILSINKFSSLGRGAKERG